MTTFLVFRDGTRLNVAHIMHYCPGPGIDAMTHTRIQLLSGDWVVVPETVGNLDARIEAINGKIHAKN